MNNVNVFNNFCHRSIAYESIRTARLVLYNIVARVGGDGLVVPSWLALCWIAQGSGFESQRGHLFFGILPRGDISQEGFAQGLVSPPATSRYISQGG
jgi:hypothetical protein